MKKQKLTKESIKRVKKALQETLGVEEGGMFPPHIDVVRKATDLEFMASDESTYSMLLESICGADDDSQPVEQYDGTLGVTKAFVAQHQSPVGQLQWNDNLASRYNKPGNVANVRWCTGVLISNDLFITAGHCFDQTGGGWNRPKDNSTGATISPQEIAQNMHVNFNYQVDPGGVLRTEKSYPILELVEYRLGNLDFAIVRLGDNPGNDWGIAEISGTDATPGDMLCIIGHPAGWPKRIEAGPCLNVSGNRITYDDIDTLGGNSGSGILRASDGRIVGIHTNGGCGPDSPGVGYNFGVRITAILDHSPILRGIITPVKPILSDPITRKELTKDPVVDPITKKEVIRDPVGPTRKEIIKDPILDPPTRKELIKDPISDPMPTLRETINPGFPTAPPVIGGLLQRPFGEGLKPYIMGAPSRVDERREELELELQIQQLVQYASTLEHSIQALEQDWSSLLKEYETVIQSIRELQQSGLL